MSTKRYTRAGIARALAAANACEKTISYPMYAAAMSLAHTVPDAMKPREFLGFLRRTDRVLGYVTTNIVNAAE